VFRRSPTRCDLPGSFALVAGSPPDFLRPSQTVKRAVLRRPVECALAAAVGVEGHARLWGTGRDRVGQRVRDQLGAQVVRHGIAHDPPRGDVDDGGQAAAGDPQAAGPDP
jgi:hypothetical protein